MKATKIQPSNTPAGKFYKIPAKGKTKSHLKQVVSHRRERAPSVVDDTFAAVSIRKHAKIESLIERSQYGD